MSYSFCVKTFINCCLIAHESFCGWSIVLLWTAVWLEAFTSNKSPVASSSHAKKCIIIHFQNIKRSKYCFVYTVLHLHRYFFIFSWDKSCHPTWNKKLVSHSWNDCGIWGACKIWSSQNTYYEQMIQRSAWYWLICSRCLFWAHSLRCSLCFGFRKMQLFARSSADASFC